MPYGQNMMAAQPQGINPWAAAAGGAAVGAGGVVAVQAVQQARSRANWALGIGIGLTALTLINSSNLSQDVTNAQAAAALSNSLTFNAAAPTGAELAALRAVVTQTNNVLAQVAFDANIWNVFSTRPTPLNVAIPAAVGGVIPAVASTQVITQSNNNTILALLVIGVVGAAVILS